MALKENLAEARGIENITSEFHKLEEFVSKPDWIETAKGQARITGLAEFFYPPSQLVLRSVATMQSSKSHQCIGVGVKPWSFTNPNSTVKTIGFGFFVFGGFP